MDYLNELKACTTVEQLYALWHKIYDLEHGAAKCSTKEWNTCQFYRFRVEAQIKQLEAYGVFLAPVSTMNTVSKDDETKKETP